MAAKACARFDRSIPYRLRTLVSRTSPHASVGIAGVNTRRLHAASLGIAGNWGSTLRPHVQRMTMAPVQPSSTRFGDKAARACWAHACYLLDYTYLTCPDRATGS